MAAIVDVILITLGITLFYSLLSRAFIKPYEVREIKKEAEFYKLKAGEAKKQKDMEKFNQYTMESMKTSQKLFKKNMKPMMITLVIFFLAFGWIGTTYSGFCVQAPGAEAADQTCIAAGESGSFAFEGQEHALSIEILETDNQKIISCDGVQYNNGDVIELGGKAFTAIIAEPSIVNIIQPFFDNKVVFSWILAQSPFVIPFIGPYLNWFWLYVIIAIPSSMFFRKLLGLE